MTELLFNYLPPELVFKIEKTLHNKYMFELIDELEEVVYLCKVEQGAFECRGNHASNEIECCCFYPTWDDVDFDFCPDIILRTTCIIDWELAYLFNEITCREYEPTSNHYDFINKLKLT